MCGLPAAGLAGWKRVDEGKRLICPDCLKIAQTSRRVMKAGTSKPGSASPTKPRNTNVARPAWPTARRSAVLACATCGLAAPPGLAGWQSISAGQAVLCPACLKIAIDSGQPVRGQVITTVNKTYPKSRAKRKPQKLYQIV